MKQLLTSLLFILPVYGSQDASSKYTTSENAINGTQSLDDFREEIMRMVQEPNEYVPYTVTAPSNLNISRTPSLSAEEIQYNYERGLSLNKNGTILNLVYNTGANTFPYSYMNFTLDNYPRVGLSFSGGGLRAMIGAAGALKALDSRSESSSVAGILQISSFMAGLSGGSWFLGSVIANDFQEMDVMYKDIWKISQNFVLNDNSGKLNKLSFLKQILANIIKKRTLGFNTCVTDGYGQMLGKFVVPNDEYMTLSSITEHEWFKRREYPFPIIVADTPITLDWDDIRPDEPIFELTPFEFRTLDHRFKASAPMKYMGTDFNNGSITSKVAVEGFDRLSFVIGTSGSMFSGILETSSDELVHEIIEEIGKFDRGALGSALWKNPFLNLQNTTSFTNELYLKMIDGAFSGMNAPVVPLLDSSRKVDIIFMCDMSGDDPLTNFPLGDTLQSTVVAMKSRKEELQLTGFPEIPAKQEFLAKGLNKKITFFGTNEDTPLTTPILIYMPNYPLVSNQTPPTVVTSLSDDVKKAVFDNMYAVVSQQQDGNGEYNSCVMCAVLEKFRRRAGLERVDFCNTCFAKYAYN